MGQHRQRRHGERQGKQMIAQQATCKRPCRRSVRDYPLHFDPHSRFDVTAATEIRGFCGPT
jgi:hypothetical protein